MKQRLEMKVNLQVLEHLGMNLYSNVPAVLAEIVANAWDADAENVWIELDIEGKSITIQDDGLGMNRDDVVNRFLNVGFKRRDEIGLVTEKLKRKPMGRKGIGKLSSFSVANTVRVYTTKKDEKTVFQMDIDEMRRQMKADAPIYLPEEMETRSGHPDGGTKIVLTNLKKRVTESTSSGLRQRIARRFSVIDGNSNFQVFIDGEPITPEDRGYCKHVQFLWTLGDSDALLPRFTNLAEGMPIVRSEEVKKEAGMHRIGISGWIGTVQSPKNLKGESGDNLNHIAVFIRGKLAQEDILSGFGEKQIYADYIVGEIHCDDLDDDQLDDIATSDRQKLRTDDERYVALREIVGHELRHIANCWNSLRIKRGAQDIEKNVPEITEWLNGFQIKTQESARRWLGRLNTLRGGDEAVRGELLKGSILAFENYRRKENIEFLNQASTDDVEAMLRIFNDLDDFEKSQYGLVAQGRLGVIMAMESMLNDSSKEVTIQRHVYNHLWLLDPSWERAKGSEAMEVNVEKALNAVCDKLTEEERRARIDIGYRTVVGKHVIVEMKRNSASISMHRLLEQISKYRAVAKKVLENTDEKDWPLEIICLLGRTPNELTDAVNREPFTNTLAAFNARIVYYDQLLGNARRAYQDYFEEHQKRDRLGRLFEAIDRSKGAQ